MTMRIKPLFLTLIALSLRRGDAYEFRQNAQNSQYQMTQVKCLISHLRSLNDANMTDEYFSSITTTPQISAPCTNQVQLSKSELLNQFIYSKTQRSACVTNAFSSDERLKNFLVKRKVIESIKLGWMRKTVNWFTNKRSAALNAVNLEITAIEESVMRSCRESQLGALFDSFFDESADEMISYDDVEEFCIKRELIDREIIRENEFQFEVNPMNLQISARSCQQIIEELKSDVYELIRDTEDPLANCKIDELDSEEYFETLLRLEFLTKLNLTSEQREREKSKFVTKMLKISEDLGRIKQCFAQN